MEIHLIPDRSIFAQAGIFIVLLFALTRLVFRPLQKIFLLRKSRTTSLIDDAKKIELETKGKTDSYTRIMDKAVLEAREAKTRLILDGIKKETEIRVAAKKEAIKIIAEAEKKVSNAKNAAATAIDADIPRLADEIIAKITQ